MEDNTIDDFESRARKGDGQFAIAYALLRLAESHERLTTNLCYGSVKAPGVLEKVGMELSEIAKAVKSVADISGS